MGGRKLYVQAVDVEFQQAFLRKPRKNDMKLKEGVNVSTTELGVGVDIVEIDRFRHLNIKTHKNFFDKIFTENEQKYCISKKNRHEHFAVRFAGKEAVIKALSSLGVRSVHKDIEILVDGNNVPYVRVSKNLNKGYDTKISLSHSKNSAIAFAVIAY